MDNAVIAGLKKQRAVQVSNISNALKEIGAWEVDDSRSLWALKRAENGSSYRTRKIYTQRTRKWNESVFRYSVGEPATASLGYYNFLTAGCFIGLALRSFVKWIFI